MAPDASKRKRQLDLYATMHMSLDHVLAKLLKDAPPLPPSMMLHTDSQPLGVTWVQLTAAFEKRKAMMEEKRERGLRKQREKAEKLKRQATTSPKDAKATTPKQTKAPRNELKKTTKVVAIKPKLKTTAASPRAGRSSPAMKSERKNGKSKQKSPRAGKHDGGASPLQPDAYNAALLRKLRAVSFWENVTFGSKKYKAVVKWLECDKAKNDGTSTELVETLGRLGRSMGSEKASTPTLSRKRSLESLDETLRAESRAKSPRKLLTVGYKGKQKQRAVRDEDRIVYDSGEEEEEPEYNAGYSDSEDDEAEFIPEIHSPPPPPREVEAPKKRGRGRPSNASKRVNKEREEKAAAKEQSAPLAAKVKEQDVDSDLDKVKYLSYGSNAILAQPGSSAQAAIVLEESEDEEEEEEEEEKEEEAKTDKPTEDGASSTDDDQDLFDLEEEDVFVVESILKVKEGRVLLTNSKRGSKEVDLYLVKWEGYNELTWEPEENIPRRLIQLFRERERAKRACNYQIKTFQERKVVTNVTTGSEEIIYMIQWENQPQAVWEARSTLPDKTVMWLDKMLRTGPPPSKKRREAKAAKQFFYQ